MKVTKDKVENSQVFLTVEMTPEEVEKGLDTSYKNLVKRVNIPGFRKGKAPRAIFERFVGKESLLEDAINHIVPDAYEKALKEQDIKAIARPEIEVTQTEPVTFKAVVPIEPTVTLGDYKSIKMSPEQVSVPEDEIEKTIDRIRHQHATWEPVDRPVALEDMVVMDIESQIGNAPFINQKGLQYYARKEMTFPAPGFAEQIAGLKKGEEKEFKLTFPADYHRTEMAGKEASFKVKVVEIKHEVLPELNDDFAKQVSAEVKTFAELKERVASDLKLRAEEKTKREFEDKVLDAAVAQAKVEFPPVLVDSEVHSLINDQAQRFQMQGINYEEYLKSMNKTGEQLHEEVRPVAEKRVIRSLVLGKVAETEKIEVSDAEIDAEIENMVKSAAEKQEELRKMFNNPRSRESIKQTFLTRKTLEKLTSVASAQSSETVAADIKAAPEKTDEKKEEVKQ